MALSAVHWNGSQACVIDTETTGLEPGYHEIIQLAILPLDSNLDIRKDVIPFNIKIKPDHPERKDKGTPYPKALWEEVMDTGYSSYAAMDLFEQWYETLGLTYKKYGSRRNQIMPVGFNYAAFDLQFMQHFLGRENYSHFFDFRIRDVMLLALAMNDMAAWKAERVPFPKTSLKYVCNQFNVKNESAHDALSDCVATQQCYKKMMAMGGLL